MSERHNPLLSPVQTSQITCAMTFARQAAMQGDVEQALLHTVHIREQLAEFDAWLIATAKRKASQLA